jgi:signal transduction histidine kinase
LSGRHDSLGVLYVDTKSVGYDVLRTQKPTKLTENHLKLMVAIAYQAGIAIEDTRFYEASVQGERLAAIGQTIATLSHHIKNILQGLRSGSYLVNMGVDAENLVLVKQGWGVVQRNQDKIFNLVMDMLSFSKEREPSFELVEVHDVVSEVVDLMKARAEDARVKVVTKCDDKIGLLAVDPEGIHRALLNIVTNGIDALEEVDHDRVIEISTCISPNGRYLHLTVQDNGPGIPADEQKRIFNIFHSTKGSKGTGLGLAVSQKVAHEHGGQIRLESQPGAGARFTIEIPVRRQVPAGDVLMEEASEPMTAGEG